MERTQGSLETMEQKTKIIIPFHRDFAKHIQHFRNKRSTIDKAINTFSFDPLDRRLKTHKLTGKLQNYWSFSIDYHLRILFKFIDNHSVLFIDIGTHEIYR